MTDLLTFLAEALFGALVVKEYWRHVHWRERRKVQELLKDDNALPQTR